MTDSPDTVDVAETQAAVSDGASGTPPPQFPRSALIGLFGDYIALVGPTGEAPDEYHWGACAASLAILMGRSAGLQFGPGELYANINVVLVGRTGIARKSSTLVDADLLIVQPLKPKPVGPIPTFQVVDGSGSGEGFFDAMADVAYEDPPGSKNFARVDGRRVLFLVHELAGLLEKMNRDQAGKMFEFLLQLFDAKKTWTHLTRSNKERVATDALGVVLAGTTESWLVSNLTLGQVYAGLANRMLWLPGSSKEPMAIRPPISQTSHQLFLARARQCLETVARAGAFTLHPLAQLAHQARYATFYASITRSDEDVDADAGAGIARSDIFALKIATLLTAARNQVVIDADAIEAAWQVVEYSNFAVQRLVSQLHSRNFDDAERRMGKAACALCRDNPIRVGMAGFTRAELWNRIKGRRGVSSELFNRVWRAWCEAGELRVLGAGRWIYGAPDA